MKIKQEVIDVTHEDGPKYGCFRGVKKYHIKKGRARKNPEFNRLKSLPRVIIKKKAEYEIEVEEIHERQS